MPKILIQYWKSYPEIKDGSHLKTFCIVYFFIHCNLTSWVKCVNFRFLVFTDTDVNSYLLSHKINLTHTYKPHPKRKAYLFGVVRVAGNYYDQKVDCAHGNYAAYSRWTGKILDSSLCCFSLQLCFDFPFNIFFTKITVSKKNINTTPSSWYRSFYQP